MYAEMDPEVKAGVDGRGRVKALLPDHLDAALDAAKAIRHPWYRCQALSVVAQHVPDISLALEVANLAIRAAYEQTEPNRVVTVASWPIRVIVKRNLSDPTPEVVRLLGLIRTEPHALRRSDALFSLLEAVFDTPELRHLVLGELLASLSASRGWRTERLWGFTALLMAGESADAALRIFDSMPEGREKRRLGRRLASPEYVGPRWIEYMRG